MACDQSNVPIGTNKYTYLNDEDLDENTILSIKEEFYKKATKYYENNLIENNICIESVRSLSQALLNKDSSPSAKILWEITQKRFAIQLNDCTLTSNEGVNHLLTMDQGIQKEIIPWESSFDIIWKMHVAMDHPPPNKLMNFLREKYLMNSYLPQCLFETCRVCRSRNKKFARISLSGINLTRLGDHGFSYVMVYQDLLTNFIQLRPISSESMIKSIILELLQLFTDFGPPVYIELNDFNNFYIAIDSVMELLQFSQYTVNKACVKNNEHISSLLVEWMSENHCSNWGFGCQVLQWEINNKLNKDGKTAFAKVFEDSLENESCEVKNEIDDDDIFMNEAIKPPTLGLEEDIKMDVKEGSPEVSYTFQDRLKFQSSEEDSDDDYCAANFFSIPGPSNQSKTQDSQSSSSKTLSNISDDDIDDDL